MKTKHIVTLTPEEQRVSWETLSRDKAAGRMPMHARIPLKADAGPAGGQAEG